MGHPWYVAQIQLFSISTPLSFIQIPFQDFSPVKPKPSRKCEQSPGKIPKKPRLTCTYRIFQIVNVNLFQTVWYLLKAHALSNLISLNGNKTFSTIGIKADLKELMSWANKRFSSWFEKSPKPNILPQIRFHLMNWSYYCVQVHWALRSSPIAEFNWHGRVQWPSKMSNDSMRQGSSRQLRLVDSLNAITTGFRSFPKNKKCMGKYPTQKNLIPRTSYLPVRMAIEKFSSTILLMELQGVQIQIDSAEWKRVVHNV